MLCNILKDLIAVPVQSTFVNNKEAPRQILIYHLFLIKCKILIYPKYLWIKVWYQEAKTIKLKNSKYCLTSHLLKKLTIVCTDHLITHFRYTNLSNAHCRLINRSIGLIKLILHNNRPKKLKNHKWKVAIHMSREIWQYRNLENHYLEWNQILKLESEYRKLGGVILIRHLHSIKFTLKESPYQAKSFKDPKNQDRTSKRNQLLTDQLKKPRTLLDIKDRIVKLV